MIEQLTFSGLADRLLALIGGGSVPAPAAEEEFAALALELYALQFHEIPVYRRFCLRRGLSPEKVSRWQDIPAVPTAAFRDFEISALPSTQRTRVFFSSGTTGEKRSRQFHSEISLRLYEASLIPWFTVHLLKGVTKCSMLALTPAPELQPHSSLIHMFGALRKVSRPSSFCFVGKVADAGGWTLDLELTRDCLEKCAGERQPVVLLGTAFSFVQLVDQLTAERRSLRLPGDSRAMETGGYKGRSRAVSKSELHALISERLGIASSHIVSEYGMSELSSQAYDHVAGTVPKQARQTGSAAESGRVFRFPPWARAQIVSAETGEEAAEGEIGLVRIFDLANVYSVLAVQTEDLARRRGDGFELLGRAACAGARGCSLMIG